MKTLQDIQSRFGYLPAEELKKLPLPIAEVMGVASFYDFFTFELGQTASHIEKLYPIRSGGLSITSPSPYEWTALEKAAAAPGEIIPAVKASGLRGRGGAGFPVGTKWELTQSTPADLKYVVCNADEGEKFTGKDRAILENNPNAVIEGMAICAIAVGAKKGIIYLRGEYADLAPELEKAIKSAPLGGFELEIMTGMGAYICGEETALLESIEGKRGEPRLKPPFPGCSGAFGKPTVINNVESFAWVPYIINKGAEEFKTHGTGSYPGAKLFTVSGCVKAPGVYELEAGTPVSDILAAAGGLTEPLQAVQTGGSSGNILPPSVLDMPMDTDGCRDHGATFGTGSLRFIGESESLRSYVLGVTEFYAGESCGMCVPCRIGLRELVKLIKNEDSGAQEIKELAEYIKLGARCAMAQAAVSPVLSWLEGWGSK